MLQEKISRETTLRAMAEAVDQALRIPPVVHIKHNAQTQGQHGLGCLESCLLGSKDGSDYCLHDWGHYGDIKATSTIFPEAPRGFMIALKTDSEAENQSRGVQKSSIPLEAKTQDYQGDYLKIDWIYPHPDIMGLGIPHRYFFAVEEVAKNLGYPSLHVDATNHGLAFWSRKEFGLKIPEEFHECLIGIYENFVKEPESYINYAKSVSPYALYEGARDLPKMIDPHFPDSLPRLFMEVVGAFFMDDVMHLHFYKKF